MRNILRLTQTLMCHMILFAFHFDFQSSSITLNEPDISMLLYVVNSSIIGMRILGVN